MEVDPEVEVDILAGSRPDLHHQERAGLFFPPVVHSRSRNPRQLRPRQLAGGRAHPRRRQGCQDQGEVADLHGDGNEVKRSARSSG